MYLTVCFKISNSVLYYTNWQFSGDIFYDARL